WGSASQTVVEILVTRSDTLAHGRKRGHSQDARFQWYDGPPSRGWSSKDSVDTLKHRSPPTAVVVGSLLFVADVAMTQEPSSLRAEEQGQTQSESNQTQLAKNWQLKFAPIFFWAPINSTTASEGTSTPPETVTEGQTGLNAAYAGRLEYQWKRWF